MPAAILYDGEALKRIRKEKGLSPEDLAQRAGVSPRAVRYLERGSEPMASTLAKLATSLDVAITAFFIAAPHHRRAPRRRRGES